MQVTDITTNPGKTKVHALLREAGISLRGIGRMVDLDHNYIRRILDPRVYALESLVNIHKVRRKVEDMLRGAGLEFDADQLWTEYDSQLDEVA